MNFKDKVLANKNKSERAILEDQVSDFQEDTRIFLESEIAIRQTSVIPQLKLEVTKVKRKESKAAKCLVSSKVNIFGSKTIKTPKQWIDDILEEKNKINDAKEEQLNLEAQIKGVEEEILSLQEMLALLA
jgi:septal ring factor EnvC (AmiA/AmiB activator)